MALENSRPFFDNMVVGASILYDDRQRPLPQLDPDVYLSKVNPDYLPALETALASIKAYREQNQ